VKHEVPVANIDGIGVRRRMVGAVVMLLGASALAWWSGRPAGPGWVRWAALLPFAVGALSVFQATGGT